MGKFLDMLFANSGHRNGPELKPTKAKSKLPSSKAVREPKDYRMYIVYFKHGHLIKIAPHPTGSYYENRDIANNAFSIVSDGTPYNLENIKSIQSIPIPKYTLEERGGIGTTGFIEYVLRMRAGNYWNEARYDLAIACLEKATQLMKYSTMGWPAKDFYRIVNKLNDLGMFKRARSWKSWIEKNIPGAIAVTSPSAEDRMSEEAELHFKSRIASCKELGTDLIEIGDTGACCAKCAMYRKRVFSLHGKNRLFPRFPKDYHFGCGLIGWPYIYGVSEPSFNCTDIVSYSNSPYIDDRTDEEKENYAKRLTKLSKQSPVIYPPDLSRIIYFRLKKVLPDDTPKSMSGFSRMRNSNSKNYQALVKKAEAKGFIFPKSLEEVYKWPENR